jgi:hypothetical protein
LVIPAPNLVPTITVSHREHLLQVNRNLRRTKRRLLLESVQQTSPPDPIAQYYKAMTMYVALATNDTDIPNPFDENSINVSNAKAA